MKWNILLRANLRSHGGVLAGIFLLLFLASLTLASVLTVWHNSGEYLQEELNRAGYGALTVWVSGIEDQDPLLEEISSLEMVDRIEPQPVIYTHYKMGGLDSDSEGQLILCRPEEGRYRFFADDLSGYRDPPAEIAPGEVYLSPSLRSTMDAAIGDIVEFPIARNGQTLTLRVAGWYEDPFMGSSMIGMKGFLIGPEDREKVLSILADAGIDALARDGAMLHIFPADSGMTVFELETALNESTGLPGYREFAYSREAISGFMLVLQNAFSGFLLAFAVVLLLDVLVVLGHQMQSSLRQDAANMGILKTLGETNAGLKALLLAQYLAAFLPAMGFGLLLAGQVNEAASSMTLTTTGILVPADPPLWACLAAFGLVLAGLILFLLWRLRAIERVSPMTAIRSACGRESGKSRRLFPLSGRYLSASLALRQLLTGRGRYAGAWLVAVLLVFFASLVGWMDVWLGPEGQGMMEAFNPANHDIGVQSFGELTQEEFEGIIRRYSGITDTYQLAMPSVSVNGADMTANVIDQPERFHLLSGRPCMEADEVVVTEFVASDFGISIGDSVTVEADLGREAYTVTGIYSCANEMGQNIGMSREGYLRIGSDFPALWCWHYFLADPEQKATIVQDLENAFGGDIHVHENTWPGLAGIIAAMNALVIFLYLMTAVFILVVTVMTGNRILAAEQKDLAIYRAMGCSAGSLRFTFALRFGFMAAAGAIVGTVLAAGLADPLASAAMRLAGISNFASHPGIGEVLFPGLVVTALYFGCGWIVCGKLKRLSMTVLASE